MTMLDRFSLSTLENLGPPESVLDEQIASFCLIPPDSVQELHPALICLTNRLIRADLSMRMGMSTSLSNNSPRNIFPRLERGYSVFYLVTPKELPDGTIKNVVCVDVGLVDSEGYGKPHENLRAQKDYCGLEKGGGLILSGHLATRPDEPIGIALIDKFLGQRGTQELGYQEKLLIFTLLSHGILPVNADGMPIPKF